MQSTVARPSHRDSKLVTQQGRLGKIEIDKKRASQTYGVEAYYKFCHPNKHFDSSCNYASSITLVLVTNNAKRIFKRPKLIRNDCERVKKHKLQSRLQDSCVMQPLTLIKLSVIHHEWKRRMDITGRRHLKFSTSPYDQKWMKFVDGSSETYPDFQYCPPVSHPLFLLFLEKEARG